MSELWHISAVEAVAGVRSGEFTPLDLLDAAIGRYETCNDDLNAVPITCFDRAREQAERIQAQRPHPETDGERCNLAGLPLVITDMSDVSGVATTLGSPVFEFDTPSYSDPVVERLEEADALIIGKGNVSEFGFTPTGANSLFGATRNPWNKEMRSGGSSGGAAAAVASGIAWGATAADLGGSLQIPAAFCGAVGLRPSIGRVPRGWRELPFDTLWNEGPIARNVADCALLLDAMSGAHPMEPFAAPNQSPCFLDLAQAPTVPTRIAYSGDLGVLPVSEEVSAICEQAALTFKDVGATVAFEWPDLRGASSVYQILRLAGLAERLSPLLGRHRERISPDLAVQIEQGLSLSHDEFGAAQRARGRLFGEMSTFFDHYDILCCPTTAVTALDMTATTVYEIEQMPLENSIDWISLTSVISLTGMPGITLPIGVTAAGLPVGLQLVGKHHGEAQLIQAAAVLEAALALENTIPV